MKTMSLLRLRVLSFRRYIFQEVCSPGLVEAHLLFLPHEEGSGERFHGHHDIDLHPYAFFGLSGRMFEAQVLFGVSEQIVFDEVGIIVAIEGDKGILDMAVGHQHDLLIYRRGFIIPGFDHHGVERDGW